MGGGDNLTMMRIGFKMIAGMCALLVGGSVVVVAEVKAEGPIKTTVCELLGHPERFNGKVVQIRATIRVGFEFSVLFDDSCDKGGIWNGSDDFTDASGVQFAYITSEADLQRPELLNWHSRARLRPITHRKDEGFQTFVKYVDQYHFEPEVCIIFECSKFKVTATFIGRFDFDDRRLRAFRNTSTGKMWTSTGGFGHLNMASFQLVWQSVSDVVAVPIPLSAYLKRK